MRKQTRFLALLLLATMLMPFTFASAAATTPVPAAQPMDDASAATLPTAYPAHWDTDVFPQTYWDQMNEIITSPADLPALIQEWVAEHGDNRAFWPYAYRVAEGALAEHSASSYPVMGIPAEDDIQEDKALELAWEQFRKDAKDVFTDEQVDAMTPSYSLQYQQSGEHIWVFEFIDVHAESCGFNKIDAKTGEVLQHEASAGNG